MKSAPVNYASHGYPRLQMSDLPAVSSIAIVLATLKSSGLRAEREWRLLSSLAQTYAECSEEQCDALPPIRPRVRATLISDDKEFRYP